MALPMPCNLGPMQGWNEVKLIYRMTYNHILSLSTDLQLCRGGVCDKLLGEGSDAIDELQTERLQRDKEPTGGLTLGSG